MNFISITFLNLKFYYHIDKKNRVYLNKIYKLHFECIIKVINSKFDKKIHYIFNIICI